jgi:chromosomal replication initiation ATPase DnaA
MFDDQTSYALEADAAFSEAPRPFYPPAVITWRTIPLIIEDVARRRCDVRPAEIIGSSREHRCVYARDEVMWIAYQMRLPGGARRHSLNMIGRHFESQVPGRDHIDHTTTRAGIRRHGAKVREQALETMRRDTEAMVFYHGR